MQVLRGSLDLPKQNSPNIMLSYENRMPDVTLVKFTVNTTNFRRIQIANLNAREH